jgi:hypothetical protein
MHKFRGAVLAKMATCCPRAAPAMFGQRGQLPPLPTWLRRLCTRPPFLFFQHNQQYDTLLPIIPCTHKLKAGIANSRQVTLIAALMLIDQPYRQYYCYEALFRQWIVTTFPIIVTDVNIEIVCFKVLFFIQPFFVVRIRCSSSLFVFETRRTTWFVVRLVSFWAFYNFSYIIFSSLNPLTNLGCSHPFILTVEGIKLCTRDLASDVICIQPINVEL